MKRLSDFKKNTSELLDEIISYPTSKFNPNLVTFFKNRKNKELINTLGTYKAGVLIMPEISFETIYDDFCETIKPHIQKIKKRDESYFINNDKLFSLIKSADMRRVIKDLWGVLTSDDKDIIWKYMEVYLRITNLWHHKD